MFIIVSDSSTTHLFAHYSEEHPDGLYSHALNGTDS